MTLSDLSDADVEAVTAARWFQGKDARVVAARVRASVRLPGSHDAALAIIEVDAEDGSRARYTAPLRASDGTLITSAPECEGLWRGLARCCARGVDVRGDGCRIVSRPGPVQAPASVVDPRASAVVSTADQTHTSVVIGGQAMLKCYRRLSPDSAREPDLVRRLTEASRARVPALLGSADLVLDDATYALVILQVFVPGAWDGFAQAERDLAAALDGPRRLAEVAAWAAAAGKVVADMHDALLRTGDAPRRADEVLAGWRAHASARLDAACARAADADRWLLDETRLALEAAWAGAAAEPGPAVGAAHGDLHLAQLLFHDAGPPFVVDFEVAPSLNLAVGAVEAPAADLAALLRSVTNAGHWGALERGAAHPAARVEEERSVWTLTVRSALARAYRAEFARLGRGPVAGPVTLRALELSQAVHELLYAQTVAPFWRPVAVAALRSLLENP